MLKSINPATGEVVGEVVNSREQEVTAVVAKARQALPAWKDTPYEERKKIILKVAEIARSRADQLGKIITSEMGKPLSSGVGEVNGEAGDAEFFAENIDKWLKDDIIDIGNPDRINKVIFEPLGVIAAITPWNYPFSLPMGAIEQSILSGNTIVVKPSEYTPLIAVEVEKIFQQAGCPDGVVNILTGDKETGKLLVESDIDLVFLTGSVSAGKSVAQNAGKNLKKVVLELGGCDPFIVCEDANLERAVNAAVWGRFGNCGQICCSTKRFYVHENLYDEFIKKFLEKTNTLQVGDPLDPKTQVGPLVSEIQRDRLEEQLKRAVGAGAKILLGGKRKEGTGNFFELTVLEIIDNKNPAMQEELFGPVASIMKFSSDEQAIQFANDNKYGLASTIFSNDEEKANTIAKQLATGTVWINNTIGINAKCPWGGTKNSGMGRTNSKYGVLQLVNIKTIEVNKNKDKPKESYWF